MSATESTPIAAWRICNQATLLLVESLPEALWPLALPAAPRRTVRNLAAHLHNSRRLWMTSLAKGPAGPPLPRRIEPNRATREQVVAALRESGERIHQLLAIGLANGGDFPGVANRFIFGAMPRDAALFAAYAGAHEAHHRGQLVLMARALGHRLPLAVANGLWQWSSRLREGRSPVSADDSPNRRKRREP